MGPAAFRATLRGMSMASTISRLVPSIDGQRNVIRELWDRLAGLPAGTALFSRAVGSIAPYTGSIGARVQELRVGFARVELEDRRKVRNHLRSVHAVALVNLAEVTGNLALAYSLPDDARFIVSGLSIDYVKKARGTITAISESPVPDSNERHEYQVPVVMTDPGGDVVARATLRSLVGPKPATR
jgi:acyl-coenzyme A thioesterase PaaI-like protein